MLQAQVGCHLVGRLSSRLSSLWLSMYIQHLQM
jgi:hypothetical protein